MDPYRPWFFPEPVAPQQANELEKAIEALRSVKKGDNDAVPGILATVAALPQDPQLVLRQRGVRLAAVEALAKVGTPEALQALRKIADDSQDPEVVEEAIEDYLEGMPDEEARRLCLQEAQKRADDPDADPVRLDVFMRGLRQEEDPPQVVLIRQILHATKNEKVRRRCIRLLSRWITDASDVRRGILTILKGTLGDEARTVREDCVAALGESGDVRAVLVLTPLLEDADKGVRRASAEAICTLLGWELHRSQSDEEFWAWMAERQAALPAIVQALQNLEEAARKGAPE